MFDFFNIIFKNISDNYKILYALVVKMENKENNKVIFFI